MLSYIRLAWNDTVWSKVIAAGIIFALARAFWFLWNNVSTSIFIISIIILILALIFLSWIINRYGTVISSFMRKPFNPDANKPRIEKAVFEKRQITGLDLLWTGIRNDNSFLEFCINDFSETWLVQELPEPILTNDIKQQIRIVNRHLIKSESRHNKVVIIILVYRVLNIIDKSNLYNQLLLFNSTENLVQKITFQVWDKSDIDKILDD